MKIVNEPTLRINGYTARVCSDTTHACCIGGDNWLAIADLPELKGRITSQWVKAAVAVAEANGKTKIVVTRTRHIRYQLRHIMHMQSGSYHVITTYSKANGWKPVRKVENDTY